MTRDYIVMLVLTGSVILSMLLFISKKNIRKALFAALVAQFITWPLGLLLTLSDRVEYPVRLFPKAADNSFFGGFILNPTVFAIFYIHYKKDAKLIWRCGYTLFITAIPMSIEMLESKYTNLIKYIKWNQLYTWMVLMLCYFIMRKYLDWFFKNVQKLGVKRNEA